MARNSNSGNSNSGNGKGPKGGKAGRPAHPASAKAGKSRSPRQEQDRQERTTDQRPPKRVFGDFIEGRHAVLEALAAGTKLKRILIANGVDEDAALENLLRKAERNDIKVEIVPRSTLDRFSIRGSHQGVMAEAAPFKYATLEDLIAQAQGKESALIVVCDHITDVGNLGAIIRTAEVVGATGVLLPNKRSAQVTAAATKTSAGATNYLPVAREASLPTCIKRLKEEGFWVAGASEHAETSVWDAPLEGRIVLVMGSEDEGISRLMLEQCDFLVKLPQAGRIESLNVAQATTAIAYEWMRRTTRGGD